VSFVEGFEVCLGHVSTWPLSWSSIEIRLTVVISGGASEIFGALCCAMLKGDSSHVLLEVQYAKCNIVLRREDAILLRRPRLTILAKVDPEPCRVLGESFV
jgi:hypothetical protein